MSFLNGVGDERLKGDDREWEGERLRDRDVERLLERLLLAGERIGDRDRDREEDDDDDDDEDFLRAAP